MTTKEATASANGATPDTLHLPVDSFRDAAPMLRRPFTVDAVKFKVQASWPSGALIVGYIDARLVVERLNLVCPHLWHDRYESPGGGLMWCHLTVDGITRSDVGEGKGKGLVSDVVIADARVSDKVKARRVRVLHEVDVDGEPLVEEVAA